MTRVVDASLVVSALVDSGPTGKWADSFIEGDFLAAPHLMPVEAANILRRAILAEDISEDAAAMAYADLIALPVELFPFEPFAERVWQLRGNVTSYDAWYVALAESLNASLITLDARLSRAPGPQCKIVTPPSEAATK